MTDDKLKSYLDRIERLADERDAVAMDIREVYVEVKAAGYKPKVLRKVVADKRRKTDEAFNAEVEAYREALGLASYRAVAERFGVSKSKLQRLVPRKKNGTATTPHDPSTGEVIESPTAGVEPPVPGAAEQAPSIEANEAGSSAANPIDESCGDGHVPVSVVTQPRAPGLDGRAAPAVATGEGAGIQSGPHDTRTWDEIVPQIDPRLDRRRATA